MFKSAWRYPLDIDHGKIGARVLDPTPSKGWEKSAPFFNNEKNLVKSAPFQKRVQYASEPEPK